MDDQALRFFLSRIASAVVILAVVILVNVLEPGQLAPLHTVYVIGFYLLVNTILWFLGVRRVYLFLLILDVLFVTLMVYYSGSHESRFQFLYLILVIYGGFFLDRTSLHLLSATAVGVYSASLLIQFAGLIPQTSVRVTTSEEMSYVIGVNFVALLLVSLLIGLLSGRVRRLAGQVAVKERKLKELTRLKNRIVDAIPSALLTTDDNWRITYANHGVREFVERHGIVEADTLIGRRLEDLVPIRELWDDSEPDVMQRMEYTFENGVVIGMNLTRMYADGQFLGVLMVFQDLTDWKAMERSMWFRNSLMSLGEMAAGIAHEIRNPLASVTGAVQLLKEGSGEGEQTGELFAIIEDELNRLGVTIQDFLSFAKDEQDKSSVENLNALVGEVLNLFEKGKPDDILLQVGPEIYRESYWGRCNRGKIKRVIWNLLKNAEKAVQYRDEKEIHVNMELEEAHLRLLIQDTGPGVPEGLIERIFEPYFSTFAKGFGLGLSISRTIVEEVGGSIQVESAPIGGACFVVTLKLAGHDQSTGGDFGSLEHSAG